LHQNHKIAIVPTYDELDASIANEVVDAIDQKEDINVEYIVVHVKDKVVTLDGIVPTWRCKDRASEAAHSIDHAKEIYTIKNELKVTHS